jgi:Fe2+ transport system protein FeoA
LLSMKMPLSDMDIGRSGVIISISGGKKTVAKLESLGIRAGALIVKKKRPAGKRSLDCKGGEQRGGYRLCFG